MIPNGIDPADLEPVDDLDALRGALRRARRAARPAGRPAGLREGLPARARGAAGAHRARSATCASSSPARAPHEAELRQQADELGLDGARHVPGLDRRRRAALALPDRRPDAWCPSLYEPFGLVALEAMASGCPCIVADTGGLREVVPDDERVGLRFNGGDAEHLAAMVERLLTDDAAARAPGRRGLRARAALRLGRRGAPDRGGLRRAGKPPIACTAIRGTSHPRVRSSLQAGVKSFLLHPVQQERLDPLDGEQRKREKQEREADD